MVAFPQSVIPITAFILILLSTATGQTIANTTREATYENEHALPKSYAEQTSYANKPTSNLCPCKMTDGERSTCYDFLNPGEKTCRMRPCADAFVCTDREDASHYCFEKTKHVTRVVPIGAGKCQTKSDLRSFRVPYVDIVSRGDERTKELNYGTLIRDDVYDLEPDACHVN